MSPNAFREVTDEMLVIISELRSEVSALRNRLSEVEQLLYSVKDRQDHPYRNKGAPLGYMCDQWDARIGGSE